MIATIILTLILIGLWFCTLFFKKKIKFEHEGTQVYGETFYYKDWLINISFIYSMFFAYFIYLCLLARGLL